MKILEVSKSQNWSIGRGNTRREEWGRWENVGPASRISVEWICSGLRLIFTFSECIYILAGSYLLCFSKCMHVIETHICKYTNSWQWSSFNIFIISKIAFFILIHPILNVDEKETVLSIVETCANKILN